MAKSKKWIRAEKSEVFRAKNLKNQSRSFLIPETRKAFTKLTKAIVEAPILNHFDPKHHIWIEKDASNYIISGIFNQLTSDDLGWWHLIAFFSKKMILVDTWYETHDKELLAIVETSQTWRDYLEGCKHKILILTDNNNL